MARQIVDILETLVSELSFTEKISAITDDGSKTTLSVCATHHVRRCSTVSIDTIDYMVLEVVDNTSITIEGVITEGEEYTIAAPKYFHGTRVTTHAERTHLDSADKVPAVYLWEIVREKFNKEPDAYIERESDLQIFFIDDSNFTQDSNDTTYLNVINPMRNLADDFISLLESKTALIGDLTSYDMINHEVFGIFKRDEGHFDNFFGGEQLSGVELSINLPILKELICNC